VIGRLPLHVILAQGRKAAGSARLPAVTYRITIWFHTDHEKVGYPAWREPTACISRWYEIPMDISGHGKQVDILDLHCAVSVKATGMATLQLWFWRVAI
jgi:hypothetical protein